MVFRFAIHCVGKRELAEDLTNEVFAAARSSTVLTRPGILPWRTKWWAKFRLV
jgi:hypothetical protein